jgi:hypothetical protein
MATPGATQDAAGNRRKSERANNRMSISWSVNINPQFSSGRTLLRIHPDGNSSGTQGCIGVLSNVGECFELIQKLFEQKKTLTLLVNHDNNNSNINNPQA